MSLVEPILRVASIFVHNPMVSLHPRPVANCSLFKHLSAIFPSWSFSSTWCLHNISFPCQTKISLPIRWFHLHLCLSRSARIFLSVIFLLEGVAKSPLCMFNHEFPLHNIAMSSLIFLSLIAYNCSQGAMFVVLVLAS